MGLYTNFRTKQLPLDMSHKLVPLCRFHYFRLLHAAPWQLVSILIGCMMLTMATVLGLWLSQVHADAEIQNAVLTKKARSSLAAGATVKQTYPVFQDFQSARLVHALNFLATRTGVPLTSVSYTLDEGGNHPYLRYRATLKVTSSYLSIREFIDGVRNGLQDVALDSISCTRENIKAVALNCELGFSAFYRKGSGG